MLKDMSNKTTVLDVIDLGSLHIESAQEVANMTVRPERSAAE